MISWWTPLYLIHPWLDTILGHADSEVPRGREDYLPNLEDNKLSDNEIMDDELSLPKPESHFAPAPMYIAPLIDKETRAYRIAALLEHLANVRKLRR